MTKISIMCKLCNLPVKDGEGWSHLYVPQDKEGYYHLQCVKKVQVQTISSTKKEEGGGRLHEQKN